MPKLLSPKDESEREQWRSCSSPVTLNDLHLMEQRIELMIVVLYRKLQRIMLTVDDILTDVQDESTVVASVETLLTQLNDQLKNAGTDPVKLQAVKTLIDQNKARLSAAVIAGTPGGPPVPPQP